MKVALFVAGLAVAILSVSPASAEKVQTANKGCSSTTWPSISAEPCLRRKHANYTECKTRIMGQGWSASDAWWGCSNQGFKN